MIGAMPAGVTLLGAVHDLQLGATDAVIVVPARDEIHRIDRLVASLAAQDGLSALTVVVANNCTDGTAKAAARALASARLPHIVLDTCVAEGGVGVARRTGFAAAAACARPDAFYLSTDADCWLEPGWLARSRAHLAVADAVCGLAAGDPDELRQLSIATPHRDLEPKYQDLARRLALRLDPGAPLQDHGQTGGASLGVRRSAYEAVGGFAPLTSGEDADLVHRLEAADYRVVYAADVKVLASCRIVGRTPLGMAATLAERVSEPDPRVDGNLEPADRMVERLLARAECRRLIDAGQPLDALAMVLGIEVVAPRFGRFGPAWAWLESVSPCLARPPMRFSALPAEMARLEAFLASGRWVPAEGVRDAA